MGRKYSKYFYMFILVLIASILLVWCGLFAHLQSLYHGIPITVNNNVQFINITTNNNIKNLSAKNNDLNNKQIIRTTTTTTTTTTTKPIAIATPPILIVYGGDSAAGFATNYFTYPINFIIYSQLHNMKLSIIYNDKKNEKYYDKNIGNNSFNYFFKPIKANNNQNNDNYRELTKQEIEYIHHISNDSIHCWYYSDYTQSNFQLDAYNATWYYKNRLKGYNIVSKYIHPTDIITSESNDIWNTFTSSKNVSNLIILGVQMRGTDKGGIGRHKVKPTVYLEYIINFILYYIDHNLSPKIYLASDDNNYIKYIQTYWYYNNYLNKSNDKHNYTNIVFIQNNTDRSEYRKATFSRTDINYSKYNGGKTCLIDILLLSKCDWFLHSASAVAEAVYYNNIDLHNKSVHLEYIYNRQMPIWYNQSRFSQFENYDKLIYKEDDCESNKFPVKLMDEWCYGMYSIHALNADMCRHACCGFDGCNAYLWCGNVTLGGRNCKRAPCWIGKRFKKECKEQVGWIGGYRTKRL